MAAPTQNEGPVATPAKRGPEGPNSATGQARRDQEMDHD